MSLNETRVDEEIKVIEDEIDAYKKLTDAMVEALTEKKNLHDYEQSIAEKTKAVADIERQLAAMQYDDSAATVAKRKQLEEQLAEAKKTLAEEEYEHSIETQKDALNKQYEAFEEERNKEIEELQLTLEDKEKLIADSLEVVKANTATVGEEIAMIAQEHGVIVSDSIISAWQSGENAIASYGEVLTSQSSAFIGNIIGVQDYVYGLQEQANSTADSLSWMFSTRADNLVNELTSSYYSEANLNAMTNTLQNSLVNTLERGYNINSITNALSSIASGADSVASAANRAAQALANMGAAQSGVGSGSGTSSKPTYSLVDMNTGRVVESGLSYEQAKKRQGSITGRMYEIKAFAKGGIVTKDKNNPLNHIAESVGEDTLIAAKEGEGVLTKEQTEDLEEFTKALKARHLVPIECAEGILSVEQIEQNRKLSNALAEIDANILKPNSSPNPNLYNFRPGTQSALIPEYVVNDRINNINVRYDSMLTVNGDINDTKHFTDQIEGIYDRCIGKTFREINQDLRLGR